MTASFLLALNELDPNPVRILGHHRWLPACEARLGDDLDIVRLEVREEAVHVLRPPADMIDRVSRAQFALSFVEEYPELGELDPFDPPLQLGPLASDDLQVPLHAGFGVRHPQMNVMQADDIRVLQNF